MGRKNSAKIKQLQIKISDLQAEYRMKVAVSIKLKGKAFDDQIREANVILDKIHTIRKKCELKAKYGNENGISDDFGIKINLE